MQGKPTLKASIYSLAKHGDHTGFAGGFLSPHVTRNIEGMTSLGRLNSTGNRYRSIEMPCSLKILLVRPGDINMCKNIRTSQQNAATGNGRNPH